MDLISYVDTFPKPGETIRGNKFHTGFGGKGANQAIACGKLGADVKMIVKIGKDAFGAQMKANFLAYGIKEEHILETDAVASGVAPIVVESSGTNNIIIIPGANDLLTPEEIRAHEDAFLGSKVLLTQLEVKLESTVEALKIGQKHGLITILNTAPAAHLPADIYQYVSILCANETELETLSGKPVKSVDDAVIAARVLLGFGAKQALITLGSQGCLLVTPDMTEYVSSEAVKAIDTTGAGDCFLGAFAYFLALDVPIKTCMKRANVVASYSVQREGTQTSFPVASELDPSLFHPTPINED
jgi:ribokinase